MTKYNKMYILSTFEKIEMFALSNRGFNKLSNDTKFIKIEVILFEIQCLQSVNSFFFFFIFYILFCSLSRINLADKMSLLLYWECGSHITHMHHNLSLWKGLLWNDDQDEGVFSQIIAIITQQIDCESAPKILDVFNTSAVYCQRISWTK